MRSLWGQGWVHLIIYIQIVSTFSMFHDPFCMPDSVHVSQQGSNLSNLQLFEAEKIVFFLGHVKFSFFQTNFTDKRAKKQEFSKEACFSFNNASEYAEAGNLQSCLGLILIMR